jgi:hypothetical protein
MAVLSLDGIKANEKLVMFYKHKELSVLQYAT